MHKNFRNRFINFQSNFFQNINLQQKFQFNNLEKCTSIVFTSIIIIEKNYRILRIKPMSNKFIAINDGSSSFFSSQAYCQSVDRSLALMFKKKFSILGCAGSVRLVRASSFHVRGATNFLAAAIGDKIFQIANGNQIILIDSKVKNLSREMNEFILFTMITIFL